MSEFTPWPHCSVIQREGVVLFWLGVMLTSGVGVSDREVDPVLRAIRDGDVGTLRGLIKKADCNLLMPNQYGWIPLHEAAHYGRDQCVKVLLRGTTTAASSRMDEREAILKSSG